MYGSESWTIKKAEYWRIDAFGLWYWTRLLRVPWTVRRSKQSILKEITPEYSLEGLMLKLCTLATWWKELTRLKRPWCWERLKAGGEGDDRGWDGWMASPSWWTQVWVNSGSWWRTGRPGVLRFMGSQRVRHNWVTELNWTKYFSQEPKDRWCIFNLKGHILNINSSKCKVLDVKLKVSSRSELSKLILTLHRQCYGLF